MNTNTRNILWAVVALIVIALLGYFALSERNNTYATAPTTTSSSTPTLSTSTYQMASSTPAYTISTIPSQPVAPNYAAPLEFSSNVTADERTSLQSQFAQVQATLKATPEDFNAWIGLGDTRKEAGDYAGAATDWQYVSKLYPQNTVSFANLADLYTNYLPDYPKAAAAYKQQIVNDPTDVYIYTELFQLYTNQYPQSSAVAEAVLKQGIAANPNAADLKAELAQYQEKSGN